MLRLALVLACIACKASPSGDPWTEIAVPGLTFYIARHDGPRPADDDDRTAYAVRDGHGAALRGADAMRAVLESKVTDPDQLATFSELFLSSVGGRILHAPADGGTDDGAARIAPPAIAGTALTYWTYTGGMSHGIERTRLDLATLAIERASADQLDIADDPVGVARQRLASNNVSMEESAVHILVDHCKAPGSAALLAEAAQHHAHPATRELAAAGAAKCPPP